MYTQENLKIPSRGDGLQLAVLLVKPVGKDMSDRREAAQDWSGAAQERNRSAQDRTSACRGIVQIVHGMAEYKERYLPFMEFLAAHGFASIIHDHRGHGESVKDRRDYGYMYETGTDVFLEDILQVTGLAREKVPGVPVVMFGHSMGSLAARSLMREHDKEVDALILSGAPCRNGAADAAISVAKVQKKIYGGRHSAKLLETMSFMAYVKRFANERSRFAWICSDPTVVEAYDADPGCGFTFTVDGFQTLFELMKRTYTKSGWKCTNPRLPILFAAGEEDPCIENRTKFNEELQYMKLAGYTDVQGILYRGMRHEICNEPEKQKVFEDVETFLRKKGF